MHLYRSYFYLTTIRTIFDVNNFLPVITLLHASVHEHHHQGVSLYLGKYDYQPFTH